MVKKTILFFLLLVGLVFSEKHARAQSEGFIVAQTGMQSFVNRDPAFSPLKYSGTRTLSSLALKLENPHKTDIFLFNFGYGPTYNKFGNSMTNINLGLLTSTFYHAAKSAEKGMHWGWSNQNEINFRSHNGFSNFSLRSDYFTAFGPTGRYLFPFLWKERKFLWENSAYMHVVGFKIQSDFVSVEPKGFVGTDRKYINSFLNSLNWFIPGKDWSLGYWSSLGWDLPTGNTVGLQYRFEYVKIDGMQPINRAAGSYMLYLKIKLW